MGCCLSSRSSGLSSGCCISAGARTEKVLSHRCRSVGHQQPRTSTQQSEEKVINSNCHYHIAKSVSTSNDTDWLRTSLDRIDMVRTRTRPTTEDLVESHRNCVLQMRFYESSTTTPWVCGWRGAVLWWRGDGTAAQMGGWWSAYWRALKIAGWLVMFSQVLPPPTDRHGLSTLNDD